MKKLFLLLAMVGLAAASCTPNGGKPGGNEGGSDEFAIEVTNIGEYGATVTVTPKDETRTYFWSVTKMAFVNEAGGPDAWMNEIYQQEKDLVDGGYETWWGSEESVLDLGVQTLELKSLDPNTTYCVYAFGVDTNGNLTSTKCSYKSFKTAVSTFDTSVWTGIWNVTSPKVYYELVANEQYVSGIQEAGEEGYTRPVEIMEDEGYALIFGWDPVAPSLPSLTDPEAEVDILPVYGEFAGNKINFLNDEVLYQGDGVVIFWLAEWDNGYIVGGTNYAPYEMEMAQDGSVTITAGGGQLTSGETGTVARFSIWVEMDGNYYPYYAFGDGAEPAYHFSGETMTAVKADAPAPAPAKLSAKKNFKVMHKFANAKSAALQFSSAVKIAKLGQLAK